MEEKAMRTIVIILWMAIALFAALTFDGCYHGDDLLETIEEEVEEFKDAKRALQKSPDG
jgi:hypothetical protein